ncbi:hypothetical protein ACQ4N7_15355 [Nodosilinea sp. AN01ver1]
MPTIPQVYQWLWCVIALPNAPQPHPAVRWANATTHPTLTVDT